MITKEKWTSSNTGRYYKVGLCLDKALTREWDHDGDAKIDDLCHYAPGWTDARVAKETGVTIRAVQNMRRQLFGQVRSLISRGKESRTREEDFDELKVKVGQSLEVMRTDLSTMRQDVNALIAWVIAFDPNFRTKRGVM